jgi:hypothetical protein
LHWIDSLFDEFLISMFFFKFLIFSTPLTLFDGWTTDPDDVIVFFTKNKFWVVSHNLISFIS